MGRKPKTEVTTVEKPKRGRGRPRKQTKSHREFINGTSVLISTDPKALQAEVMKLSEWCLKWSDSYEAKQKELEELQKKYEMARVTHASIIMYLESKLEGATHELD